MSKATHTMLSRLIFPWGAVDHEGVDLLLVPQAQITPDKAPCTFGAFERLILCMRALVPFEIIKASKGSSACGAYMKPSFRCLRGLTVRFSISISVRCL